MEYTTESHSQPNVRPPRIFERLSQCVVLSSPVPHQPYINQGEPELIVFCSWMGAAPRHIRKYAEHYSETYPHAAILLTTTSVADMLLRPDSHQLQRLKPAVDRIKRTIAEASAMQRKPRILFHVLSNGGAHTACGIAEALHKELCRPVPVTAMVLDSCPGRGDFMRCVQAISVNLPRSPALYVIGIVAVYTLLAYLWLLGHLLGWANVIERARRRLNDESLFDSRAPRLYAYSKADRVIGWNDVKTHADDALRRGCDIVEMQYDNSAHVCLVRDNSKLYWAAVKGIWMIGFKTLHAAAITFVFPIPARLSSF
ncbi:hypothetical protein NA57DRAFT_59288 [Rhizodiscina lignyota]|uniref:Indole-diterpene biosynthesis protein PaxU n=1 Tax=Rhizodiscina lignyota TaxID=1504668 RepID=A0A9P4IAQ3_9PEZI|nr:hypothetical protein NA57DRAFT_59288 [Rhizodiscina lignyota]